MVIVIFIHEVSKLFDHTLYVLMVLVTMLPVKCTSLVSSWRDYKILEAPLSAPSQKNILIHKHVLFFVVNTQRGSDDEMYWLPYSYEDEWRRKWRL